MAITIIKRPREYYYTDSGSPAVAVYSNWNAIWNPLVYTFSAIQSDIRSSLAIKMYEVGTNTLLSSDTRRPFRTGEWNIDLSNQIRSYLYSKYETDFTTDDNCKDEGNALNFYITYQQSFDDGSTPIFNSEQDRPIVACCAAFQFGRVLGANMALYTPFNQNLSEDKKMKFMTGFKNPVMFKGYPFTLSFIYSLNMLGVELVKEEKELDSNKNVLLTTYTGLSPVPAGKVNYLKINEPSDPLCRSIRVCLRTGEPIDNVYVEDGYVDNGYTQIL